MKRIVDERPESPEAAFLRAASGRHAPSRAKKRALASVALAASTLGTTSTAAATGVAGAAWLKGALGLAVLVLGISAGVALHAHDTKLTAPATLTSPAKAKLLAAPAPHAPPSPSASVAAPHEEGPVTPAPPRAHEPARAAPATASAPSPTSAAEAPAVASAEPPRPSSLADEITRLEAAKAATNGGRGAEALAALDAYAAAHPKGKLRQEADALRIRALVAAGRRGDAATQLRAFRATYPTSPHTAPLEALVGP